ncbi:MAG: 50S ribosomal protein L11 methyltransferase [Alphaproteobacteria bacterium]|nr:50S ribosomal protein L11 methyltransferase [Alphaproteobacteria bacterium]
MVDVAWMVTFRVAQEVSHFFEEGLGDAALAVSCFEIEKGAPWQMQAIFERPPEASWLVERLAALAASAGVALPEYRVEALPDKDWVSEVLKSFPPLHVGRYYVYGSHITETPPPELLAIRMDAGMAFGSGEHATTSGCLRAMDVLARDRKFSCILDMGSGSGILAIAAALTWSKAFVQGVDIDAKAVDIANENSIRNGLPALRHYAGDGYAVAEVAQHAPYDLILSNILANPLIAFAPQLAAHLAPGGIAVLSGLLEEQEPDVIAAHEAQGLHVITHYVNKGWSALVMGR